MQLTASNIGIMHVKRTGILHFTVYSDLFCSNVARRAKFCAQAQLMDEEFNGRGCSLFGVCLCVCVCVLWYSLLDFRDFVISFFLFHGFVLFFSEMKYPFSASFCLKTY